MDWIDKCEVNYLGSIVNNAVQVNDGLQEAAACASTVVYDKVYGLVYLIYMTGTRTSYGESSGRICLSVFPPAQPTNIRFRRIDEGIGASRGVLCPCAWMVGDGKIRILFTTTRGDLHAYYRDYDFLNDTVSDRVEMLLQVGEEKCPVCNENYRKLIAPCGYEGEISTGPIITNKTCVWRGEVYTALTLDGKGYPVLCKIVDNLLVPFAHCPIQGTYEFRYYVDDTGIHGVFRHPIDDQGTGKTGYVFSGDGGKTWACEMFEDGIQSRPDVIPYYGKPLIIYNYLSDRSVQNFPPMHNHRNAIKMVYDGKVILNCFEKYGIVEHFTTNIMGDLYFAFSTCEQALSIANNSAVDGGGGAWVEQGHAVEQGKEEIKWVKLGYLLD